MSRSDEFFHGTTVHLKPGDKILPMSGHAYFTSHLNTAVTMAHAKASGQGPDYPQHTVNPRRYLYSVKPAKEYETDPNMPAHTPSYRSTSPLTVLNEVQIGPHSSTRSRTRQKGFGRG